MEHNSSKEKEVIVDIEIGHEASHEANAKTGPTSSNKWGKKSLNKLVSGVLGFNGSSDGGPAAATVEYPNETTGLLVNENHEQSQGAVPEKKKGGKVKKAPKPPRPPRGPSLDASDMRLIKEISKIAMKKRERIERIKTLKKLKAARMTSSSSAASSASLTSSGSTISAMVITVLFFLVLILQGLGSSSSSNMRVAGAPRPAPETTGGLGLTPAQFYKTVMYNDGAAPSFVPPKFMQ
ncbi:hypothetical protein PHJA_002298000 [Phtheirospermum japonicum]|uniref:Transmembrane protein n=1 Tax=Phtheirospermum japonicum TaxID=374723 RepID=A0A830CP15_9LAMI|nr:hypothetical protein PHJA_002298000 [Phtheirospermum japonicum]